MFWRKKAPQIGRRDVANLRPVRNEAFSWDRQDDGSVKINMVCRRSRLGKVLSFLFYIPREQRRIIELDTIGSFVWERCDGKTNVSGLTEELSRQYQLSRREAEVSLMAYLKTLGERNLIGFIARRKGKTNLT